MRSSPLYFIGLDMVDPYALNPRPCDGALLDSELRCRLFQWDYRADGRGAVPASTIGSSFLLAIDGPQGLAGVEDATSRVSERVTRTPGHTRYQLPISGSKKPYDGFIKGSVELFHRLVKTGHPFRLLGLNGVTDHEANLMEVYPHAGRRALTSSMPLPNKATRAGRQARLELLKAQGVLFPGVTLPTHDQLDAAMAAWTGYCFAMGLATKEGEAPWLDLDHEVIREGYIVQPRVGS